MKIEKLVLATLLVIPPLTANADVVTWEATGTLDGVDTTEGFITEFPNATVGTPFTLTFTFDSSSGLSSATTGANGFQYRYYDAPLSVELTIDGTALDRAQQDFASIDIWDDFTFSGSSDPASDGFNLIWGVESSQMNGFAQVGLILRGPEDLDIFSGQGLPTGPSPLLTTLSLVRMQFGDETDSIVGNVESVTLVPPVQIGLSFAVEGFVDRDGQGGAPTDPVTASFVYEAASLTSPIQSLQSASLTIGGFTYAVEDLGFVSPVDFDPDIDVIGGALNGPDYVVSDGSNDFFVSFDRFNDVGLVLLYRTAGGGTRESWRSNNFTSLSRIVLTVDADGDGVDDGLDLCPATLPGDLVDPNGCSANDAIDLVIAEIFTLIDSPVSDKARDKLGKAQDKLNDALAELAEGDVKKGLKKIGGAVKELLKAEKEGVDVDDLIDQLVELARTQAQSAIDAGIAAGGDSKKIAKAQKEFAKAEVELAKGKPDKAIDHYAKAWDHAQKA